MRRDILDQNGLGRDMREAPARRFSSSPSHPIRRFAFMFTDNHWADPERKDRLPAF